MVSECIIAQNNTRSQRQPVWRIHRGAVTAQGSVSQWLSAGCSHQALSAPRGSLLSTSCSSESWKTEGCDSGVGGVPPATGPFWGEHCPALGPKACLISGTHITGAFPARTHARCCLMWEWRVELGVGGASQGCLCWGRTCFAVEAAWEVLSEVGSHL